MVRRYSLPMTARALLAAAAIVVCASAQTGPAAQVTALTGRVDVLRDGSKWALNLNDQVQPKQIIVTGPDGFAQFRVSDGSTFEVFPNSQTVFRPNVTDWKQILDVFIGRVKVHIEKLNGQPNHNKVHTPTAVISVRGTTFDVDVEDQDATTLVSVEEGTVWVEHRLLYNGVRVLNAGEWIRVFRNQPLAVKQFDKGNFLRNAMRVVEQQMYELIYRRPGGTGGTAPSAGGGGTQADKGKNPPPPTSAPPPPPPPGP